ncbi:trans-sulfuration enzyme family protein [Sphingomonas phyllosphaerae]|uniref:trans-sulfuration enzyme family protein n=1 Tax=Sphingomonas phyllosphaerae TaxID=257003 RepID=UPI0024133618|nr:PLP-dependent aspartate aminotransferase family protein [Sphingomonas phyllosphaerae]
MKIETIAVHSGRQVDQATGAVSAPLHLSTTFERDADGGFSRGFEYSRDDNPNRRSLETALAALEGGEAAVAYSSGMAAISASIEALRLDHPGRLVLPRNMYFGVRSFLTDTAFGRSLETIVVDMADHAAIEAACRDGVPGIVWIETPSNPLVSIVDVAAVTTIAEAAGFATVADNTWATPVLQRPFEQGVDVIVHSLTKYIGGHSDVMAGAAIVREAGAHLDELRAIQRHRGVLASTFDSWLALRGIATLPTRMRAHSATALTVSRYLEGHLAVARVHYPGLPSHPGHEVASQQMREFGGMVSFEVHGGRDEAMAVAAALTIFTRATSLGGNHSLVEHRASVEGPATTAPESLLRVSIGLEHGDDLIADLAQALDSIAKPGA